MTVSEALPQQNYN